MQRYIDKEITNKVLHTAYFSTSEVQVGWNFIANSLKFLSKWFKIIEITFSSSDVS